MGNRVGGDREPRWLLQSNFTPVRPDGLTKPDSEAACCRPHMASALQDWTDELLTTSSRTHDHSNGLTPWVGQARSNPPLRRLVPLRTSRAEVGHRRAPHDGQVTDAVSPE